jgi:hypothetical protein
MKAQRVLMGFGSLVGLLFFAHVSLAQPQCVAVTPHEVEVRIITALQALPPDHAKQVVTKFESLTADAQHMVVERLRRILQLLPPAFHQPFINGLLDVSPREAQFAAKVLRVMAQMARGAELPATCSSGPVM